MREYYHFKEACREASASVKRTRSSSRDKGRDRSRSRSKTRGEKKKHGKKERTPTPGNYPTRTRKASHSRYSDSEPDKQRDGRSRSRSPVTRSDRQTLKTHRVKCRTRQVAIKVWRGLSPRHIKTLRKLEHRLESRSDAETAKQLGCNIFKGKRPKVPQISCTAHKFHRSSKEN